MGKDKQMNIKLTIGSCRPYLDRWDPSVWEEGVKMEHDRKEELGSRVNWSPMLGRSRVWQRAHRGTWVPSETLCDFQQMNDLVGGLGQPV